MGRSGRPGRAGPGCASTTIALPGVREGTFIATKEHRRFVDFAKCASIVTSACATARRRILKINGLSVITDDVVEAARSTLVIGAT